MTDFIYNLYITYKLEYEENNQESNIELDFLLPF